MPLGTPPPHKIAQALIEWNTGLKAKQSLGFCRRRKAAGNGINRPLLRKLRIKPVPTHRSCKRLRQLQETSFGAARNVEYFIADIRLGAQNVGPRNITDVNEIHCLLTVSEDNWRLTSLQSFHPTDKHLGVSAMDVHAVPINIEISEGHI